jgi:hypothetical protein
MPRGNFSPLRYKFLDANHIFYSSSEALTNYPNLMMENIHTFRRTILGLDFPDVVPGTTASCYLSIPQNSMPHTSPNCHSAGTSTPISQTDSWSQTSSVTTGAAASSSRRCTCPPTPSCRTCARTRRADSPPATCGARKRPRGAACGRV